MAFYLLPITIFSCCFAVIRGTSPNAHSEIIYSNYDQNLDYLFDDNFNGHYVNDQYQRLKRGNNININIVGRNGEDEDLIVNNVNNNEATDANSNRCNNNSGSRGKIRRVRRTRGKYIGCFGDQGRRGLSGFYGHSPTTNTIESCISYCREGNFVFAGAQFR